MVFTQEHVYHDQNACRLILIELVRSAFLLSDGLLLRDVSSCMGPDGSVEMNERFLVSSKPVQESVACAGFLLPPLLLAAIPYAGPPGF
jgi:hypothetical protein